MILILSFWSCTALSQNDSLKCFTLGEVKTFLLTKVELNNCLEQYDIKAQEVKDLKEEKEELQDKNYDLKQDLEKSNKKAKRRLGVAIGAGGGFIAVLALWLGLG